MSQSLGEEAGQSIEDVATEQPAEETEQSGESRIDQTLAQAGLSLARGIAQVDGVLAFSQGPAEHCVTPTHQAPPTKAPVNVLPSTGEGANGSTPPPTSLLMLLAGAILLGGGAYVLVSNGGQPNDSSRRRS